MTGGGNNFPHNRLIRQVITYSEETRRVFLGDSSVYPIIALEVVDLRRDVWQAAFPEIEMADE